MQAAQQQHPTWLSDSTWNSINALDSAPPPGSTIFVAAPPRVGRYGTPGHSLVPTLSERTTQTSGLQQNLPMGAGAVHSPRSFAMLAPTTMFAGVGAGNGDTYLNGTGGDTGQLNRDHGGSGSDATDRASSTFGFHNWLLQPYEGGADSLGFGIAGSGGGGVASSPSGYNGVDAFQGVYDVSLQQQGQGQGRMNAGQEYAMGSATPGMVVGKGQETDASTLLDFLSMLPGTGSPKVGGMQGKG